VLTDGQRPDGRPEGRTDSKILAPFRLLLGAEANDVFACYERVLNAKHITVLQSAVTKQFCVLALSESTSDVVKAALRPNFRGETFEPSQNLLDSPCMEVDVIKCGTNALITDPQRS